MTVYTPDWDLKTIPDDKFASERGRRNRARQGTRSLRIILEPCIHCAEPLGVRQRRGACPMCGKRQKEGKR